MKLLILGITCLGMMLVWSGFATGSLSSLSARQAQQIASDHQLTPHQRKRQLDSYLHDLPTDHLLEVVKSTGSGPTLMRFARGGHAPARVTNEPASAAKLPLSPEMRHRLIQSLSSFLLNSSRVTSVSR